MLFLQAALAFAPCEQPGQRAAMVAMQMDPMSDCHEVDQAANLCLAHCQGEDQTLAKAPLSLPDLAQPSSRIRVVAAVRDAAPVVRFVVPHGGPPPRVRFQSFLL